MTAKEFYKAVADDPDLEWLGCSETHVYVKHGRSIAELVPGTILDHGWPDLSAAIKARRPFRLMMHLARIVGYYSLVKNWNRSKVAELADRHKGSYGVPAHSHVRG